jgi:hypothetical protein
MMHGREKSDSAIVAGKPANKAERSAAEPVKPRAEAKGNAGQQSTRRTQSRISVSKALARIRQHEQDQNPPRDQKGPHHRHARRARATPRRACGAPTLIKRLISAGTTEVGDLPFLEIAAEPLVLSTLLGHSLKV